MQRRIFKDDHPDTAASMNNIGTLYQSMGDHKKALEYYFDSLEMRKRIFKGDHPYIVTSMSNIGNLYKLLGKRDLAEQFLLDAQKMRKRLATSLYE